MRQLACGDRGGGFPENSLLLFILPKVKTTVTFLIFFKKRRKFTDFDCRYCLLVVEFEDAEGDER